MLMPRVIELSKLKFDSFQSFSSIIVLCNTFWVVELSNPITCSSPWKIYQLSGQKKI